MNVGGSGRRSGDDATPEGDVENTQSRGAFASVGVSRTRGMRLSRRRLADRRHEVRRPGDRRRHHQPDATAAGLWRARRSAQSHRPVHVGQGSVDFRRYRHEELVGDRGRHEFRTTWWTWTCGRRTRRCGRMTGTVGVSGGSRTFDAIGEEALSPKVEQGTARPSATRRRRGRMRRCSSAAGSTTRLLAGGGLRARDFNNVAARWVRCSGRREASTVAVSFARAARNPALEELYFYGLHAGNFSFEIGNENLDSEVALGLDVSFRSRLSRMSAEVTYFNNPSTTTSSAADRRDHRGLPGDCLHRGRRLLQGVEAHADIEIGPRVFARAGRGHVHGELRDSGEPLPRIPPLRHHRRALPPERAAGRRAGREPPSRIASTRARRRRPAPARPAVRRVLAADARPACTRSRRASTTSPTRPTATTCPTSRTWCPKPVAASSSSTACASRCVCVGPPVRPRR